VHETHYPNLQHTNLKDDMHARTIPFQDGAVTQTKLALPDHWAHYLINGDKDYLSVLPPEEQSAILNTRHFGHCVDCDDNVGFMWHHDAVGDGVLPTTCMTFTFVEMH
jgi:hypothetical protein